MRTRTPVYALLLALCLNVGEVHSQNLDGFIDDQTIDFSEGYDERLRYTPSTVILLDREYIENSGVLTIAELLERIIGIHMTRKPYGASSNQFIRGLDSSLLILHNGIQNAKLIPELLAMPVVDLERVEVLKGSHYPLYGASAILGTINLVTSGVVADSTRLGVRAGTENTKQFSLIRSDKLGSFGYSAYISHTETDTTSGVIQEDLQTNLDNILGIDVSLAPGEGAFGSNITDARLTLELGDKWVFHQYVNRREFGIGTGVAQALDPNGTENITYYTANLRYKNQLGSGDLEARLTYNYLDLSYRNLTALPPGSALMAGVLPDGIIQHRYDKSGHDINAEVLYRIRAGKNTLDIGVGAGRGYLNNEADLRNYTITGNQILPIPNGEIVDFLDTSTEPLFGGDTRVDTAYVMLRDERKITDVISLNAGARVDYSSNIGTHLIPRIGVDWLAAQSTNVTLLYGESVLEPDEVTTSSQGFYFAQGDEELKPARIQLLELAMDHKFNPRFDITTNIYGYKQTDAIAIVNDTDAPSNSRFTNLTDGEKGVGLEALLNWKITSNSKLTTGFSIVNVQTNDESIASSPRFEPYLEFNHMSQSRVNTNLAIFGITDRGRRTDDLRPPLEDYAIVNASISKKDTFIPGMDLTLSVQNLLDSDAREDISPIITFDLPVYPQRIIATMTYKF